jgi:sec-independent protein translocase protein TatA
LDAYAASMESEAPIFLVAAIGAEWLIVGGVILLLFGGSQIPKLARSLGQASKEFKDGQDTNEPGAANSDKTDKRTDDDKV